MIIDLKKTRTEACPRDLDVRVDLPGLTGPDRSALLVRPAHFVGVLEPVDQGVELRGRMEAEVRLGCHRCLEIFERTLNGEFFLQIVGEAVEFGAGEVEIHGGDTTLFYATEGKADLAEILTEQAYLAMPLKAVCRPDCRGLCPTCGVNRNGIECDCQEGAVDPRLAPLLAFKKNQKPKGGS